MYCCKCGQCVEEVGGTQLTGCYHFLCIECLESAVEETTFAGVRCTVLNGFHRCKGYVSHEELEFMVSEEIYARYVERVGMNAGGNYDHGNGTEDDYDNSSSASGSPGVIGRETLHLTEDDYAFGWAHKLSFIDELINNQGLSPKDAEAQVEKMPLLETKAVIECTICMDDEVAPGEGVVIKECFHMFCKSCLVNLVEHNDEATVRCPYIDGNYSCVFNLQEREIKGLVTDAVYEKHLEKSLKFGESSMENAFHCKTPDCGGWCVYDEGVTRFRCPLCKKKNCIPCKVIHDGSCEDYKNRIQQNANDKLSEEALEELIRKGEFMRCPKCKIPVQKVVGCDWIQCTCCKTEICWATKGPRWGPKGNGDTSGGCRCRLNGILCHPNCGNCH